MINFIPSEEQIKARALWIYYHTVTEWFDRNLRYVRPSIHEEGVVVPFGSSVFHSNKYASNQYKLIKKVARHYNISNLEMDVARLDIIRLKHKHIESLYHDMDNADEFNFIEEYLLLEEEKKVEPESIHTISKW